MSLLWPPVRFGDVLKLQRRWVELDPLQTYTEIGVPSFGRGIFHKAPVSGASLGNKRVVLAVSTKEARQLRKDAAEAINGFIGLAALVNLTRAKPNWWTPLSTAIRLIGSSRVTSSSAVGTHQRW